MVLMIIFWAITIGNKDANRTLVRNIPASGGVVDLSSYDFDASSPITLTGQWLYAPGEHLTPERAASYENWEAVDLPHMELSTASGIKTYKLTVICPPQAHLMGYLALADESYELFVNGRLVRNFDADEKDYLLLFGKYTYDLDFDRETEQEILIVANEDAGQSLFFKNTLVIGGSVKVSNYLSSHWGITMFQLGLLIFLIAEAAFFLVVRFELKRILYMTLFEWFLATALLLGFDQIRVLFSSIAGFSVASHEGLLRAHLFVLMLAGICGYYFATFVLRGGRISRVGVVICLTYLALSLLFLLLPVELWFIPRWITLINYALTFLSVFPMLIPSIRRTPTLYNLLLSISTAYIAVIVFLDILQLTFPISWNLSLDFFYIFYFLINAVLRLLDHREAYQQVYSLNVNLESMVAKRTYELTAANAKLGQLAVRDALTGTYNRLFFEQNMEKALEDQRRNPCELSLCILDIDKFKQVNDLYGHAAGDEVLKALVRIIERMLDRNMELARIGGEEFVILFKDVPYADVILRVEAIRHEIEIAMFPHGKPVTASFGVVKHEPDMTIKSFLQAADGCLYRAKHMGRNRVVAA